MRTNNLTNPFQKMASPKDITSFTGNLSDRFCQDSLKCLVCLDELTTQRGLVEFPCCNNIFACLCCFIELVVVNQSTIAPCCRRPLNFVRGAGSAMRRQIERERQEAELQLEQTQRMRRSAEADLVRIRTENRRFEEEHQQVTYKLAILRSTQEEQERVAAQRLEMRRQQEHADLMILEQRRQDAIRKEKEARDKATQYADAQKRRREIERKIRQYIAEINSPKTPASHFGRVYQDLCKLLSKYPDMEEFILTAFSDIRMSDTLTGIIAAELNARVDEITDNTALRAVVRLQIIILNSLEYTSQVCDLYYRNYLYAVQPYRVPRESITMASRLLGKPISLNLSAAQFQLVVSYDHNTGFSFSRKSDCPGASNVSNSTQLPTNVESNARLANVFALCEVTNTDVNSYTAKKCFAAFTLDTHTSKIIIHLLEYDVNELFGTEDAYVSKIGDTNLTQEIATQTLASPAINPFQVTKFAIEKCGRDLFQPTIPKMKTIIRFA